MVYMSNYAPLFPRYQLLVRSFARVLAHLDAKVLSNHKGLLRRHAIGRSLKFNMPMQNLLKSRHLAASKGKSLEQTRVNMPLEDEMIVAGVGGVAALKSLSDQRDPMDLRWVLYWRRWHHQRENRSARIIFHAQLSTIAHIFPKWRRKSWSIPLCKSYVPAQN